MTSERKRKKREAIRSANLQWQADRAEQMRQQEEAVRRRREAALRVQRDEQDHGEAENP
jgi:Lon protease-like protein